jgi:hypothetical protein
LLLTLPAVLFLAVLVFLLIRYAGLRAWQALICALFGFFLATSSLGPYVTDTTRVVARWLSGVDA